MKSVMKTVLLFQSSLNQANRDKFDGVYQYAQHCNWRIQSIQYGFAAKTRRPQAHITRSEDITPLLDFWKPDGCIVEGGEGLDDAPMPADFGRIPAVFLDRPKGAGYSTLYSDGDEIGCRAARELMTLGLGHFAYVGWWVKRSWSEMRGAAFARALANSGYECSRFDLTDDDTIPNLSLQRWIRQLPRPCGIFTANDLVASRFIFAADDMGFGIPDDFAVLGVDNDEEICENTSVSLSSIPQDCLRAGISAGEMLDKAMNQRLKKPMAIPFGALPTVHRASTRIFRRKDERLMRAFEFIRRQACKPGITVNKVALAAGCSRRQLDVLFRDLVQHTVLDEIHDQRICRAYSLLSSLRLRLSEIAERCGFHSASDFSRAFKRATGHSPSKPA